eukprot:COSAG02_NODE_1874_length_10576_cov_8.410614_1_plen_63_part_10
MQAHWANWMFEIDQWDPETKTIGWTRGGFQGARGNDRGGEWYVDGPIFYTGCLHARRLTQAQP